MTSGFAPGILRSRKIGLVAALLLSIPVTTLVGARVLTVATDLQRARLAQAATPQLQATAAWRAREEERARLAPIFAQPMIGDVAERLARHLPPWASLHSLAVGEDGTLAVEVDVGDPDLLRPAFADDPLLRQLRITSQSRAPERGMRVLLQGKG